MFGNKVSKSLVDAVKSIPGWEPVVESVQLDEKKQEMKSVPVSDWEKNKSKLIGAHHDTLKKGYVYVGSEEKEGVLGQHMTNHNYIAKDSSHHKHIMYPSYSLGSDKFELTHLTTPNGARKHYDLTESVVIHEDLDPLQELSKDTLKSYQGKAMKSALDLYKSSDPKDNAKGKKRANSLGRSYGQAMGYKMLKKEEVEQIEELSDKTLKSYAEKSHKDLADKAKAKDFGKTNLLHRAHGMQKVKDRLAKEECDGKVKFADKFGAKKRLLKAGDKETEGQNESVELPEEDVLTEKKTKDTLKGREPGGCENDHISSKVTLAAEETEPFSEGFIDSVKSKWKELTTAPIDRPGAENTHAGKMDHHYTAGMAAKKAGNKELAKHHEKELTRLMKMKEETELTEKNWIAGAIKHPGALHKKLGVPEGEKIPASKLDAAAKEGGKIGKEANLAKTLKGMHKEESLDELSTDTLKSYEKKAHDSYMKTTDKKVEKKRAAGLDRAVDKLEKRNFEAVECSPLQRVKELAKASHKKIRQETLGIAPDNSTGI